MGFFRQLFSTDFMPHGFCLRWDPGVLWLHISCDALIALSYLIIPLALVQFARKRKDFGSNWILIAFGIFILSCGATHALNVLTLWVPMYRLDGLIKAITAVASMITCVLLIRSVPRALRLPSPETFRTEIALREEAQRNLRRLNSELENRVVDRTASIERYTNALEHVAYIASHDLREPLHTMHTFTELLDRRCGARLDEEEKILMKIVIGGSRRMQTLIDDLLEYTRVIKSADDLMQMAEPTSLEEAAREAILTLDMSIRELRAEINIESDLPTVRAQLAPLRQVFQNLLSNAMKYHRPGYPAKIDIRASVRGSACVVTVQDDGIGLDMRYSATIFEPFKRLHGPDIPGSGVGLALCKSMMESFGGTIWVESAGPGTGTQFHFTLPVGQTALRDAL